MSKSKKQEIGSTPAPWALSPDGWIDAGEDPVCMISTNDLTERETADARLICAAPELLKACQEFLRIFKTSTQEMSDMIPAADMIAEAVDKAEGT